MPAIPASALELDIPWNCVYCQKGTKCPYLTESLDVLQTLMSDEEEEANDENISAMDTSEEFHIKSSGLKKKRVSFKKMI